MTKDGAQRLRTLLCANHGKSEVGSLTTLKSAKEWKKTLKQKRNWKTDLSFAAHLMRSDFKREKKENSVWLVLS